ncbi:TBC1 domain family member 7 [Aplysia californica]|uniref:TBC1 domain family member 7 n=1 Tax=Aplysia californica TaxID=6500 RepID=A0ABM0K093_APLCA|nr:TBC1 domain family member 7 [Aplysia californica]
MDQNQERNFRTHYYEKVRFFPTVEEKKSVESLLKEQPIQKEKLGQFCLRFGIPAVYRTYVWKLLLGVLPLNRSTEKYVWGHREEQVKELERAAVLVRPQCLDETLEQKILRMKLIEDGALPIQDKFLEQDPTNQYFVSIAQAVSGLTSSESEADLFWISTRFFRHISSNIYSSLPQFPELTLQCLQKEDVDHRLHQHLCDLRMLEAPLLSFWFHTCFASVLPESALERIWDRVISGSAQILVYVAVSILLTLRRPLLALTTSDDMLTYLKHIPEDCGDRIVNEALELLHKNSSQTAGKPDSPAGEDSGRSSGNKPGGGKPRQGSQDTSTPSDKVVRSLVESKSVTIEIARKSPNAGDKAG